MALFNAIKHKLDIKKASPCSGHQKSVNSVHYLGGRQAVMPHIAAQASASQESPVDVG